MFNAVRGNLCHDDGAFREHVMCLLAAWRIPIVLLLFYWNHIYRGQVSRKNSAIRWYGPTSCCISPSYWTLSEALSFKALGVPRGLTLDSQFQKPTFNKLCYPGRYMGFVIAKFHWPFISYSKIFHLHEGSQHYGGQKRIINTNVVC